MISTNITTVTMSHADGFAMPASVRERAASVRVLPTPGAVAAATAGLACTPATGIQGTSVSGYRLDIDAVAVRKGAFPGTSAWSPPI
jgi:hypothetical protein